MSSLSSLVQLAISLEGGDKWRHYSLPSAYSFCPFLSLGFEVDRGGGGGVNLHGLMYNQISFYITVQLKQNMQFVSNLFPWVLDFVCQMCVFPYFTVLKRGKYVKIQISH